VTIRQVVGLARHYRRAPDQLSADEVQTYLAHLFQARKRSWSTCAQAAHAFRFFYHVTLGREKTAFHVPAPKQQQKLPDILSRACCAPAPTPGIGSCRRPPTPEASASARSWPSRSPTSTPTA